MKLCHSISAFNANMSVILPALLLIFAGPTLSTENPGRLQEPVHHEEVPDVSSGECPRGWVDASFVDMGCLYFNSTEALASWDDSASMCQMATPNATLVEILTEDQVAFVQMEIDLLEAHEAPRHWWTGATDVGINGKWFWAPSLSPVEDFVWVSPYPKDELSNNCMIINYSSNAGTNINCDYTAAYPLCQMK